MSIRSAIRRHLIEQPSIAALVGSRVYGLVRPQSTAMPCIAFHRVSGTHGHTLSGADGSSAPVFRFECWSNTYEGADDVAEALRNELDGLSGTLDGVQVTSVVHVNEEDDFMQPQDASDEGAYVIISDYSIQYRISTPTL